MSVQVQKVVNVIELPKPRVDVIEQNTSVTVKEDVINIIAVAAQGPAGVDGTGSGSDKNFTQNIDGLFITINHNLGKRPAVTVIDNAGDEVEGSINHVSINQLTLTFSAAVSGMVICN